MGERSKMRTGIFIIEKRYMNQPDYLIKTFPIILLFMIAASACNQSHENNEGVKDKKEANLNSGRQTNAMNYL